MTCTRREVLYTIGMTTAAGAWAAGGLAGCTDDTVPPTPSGVSTICGNDLCISLSANPALATVGGALIFTGRGRTVIVVNKAETEFVAFSALCTHAACTVAFDGGSTFHCPCHGSRFAIDGAVTEGPATRGLSAFPATVAGDVLTIALPAV
jgi:Rieske Fe-S protein